MHLYLPNYISPELLLASVFSQVHICVMVRSFVSTSIHWSPASPFNDSLHYAKNVLYFLEDAPLSMRCAYTILWSTSIAEVIYRRSNTPTVRQSIMRTTAVPIWSNVSIRSNFPFTRFWLVYVRIFIVHDKYLCFFSFLVLITIFYFVETDSWINTKGFIPRRRIFWSLGCWGLFWIPSANFTSYFRIVFTFQHKSIFNRASGSNITATRTITADNLKSIVRLLPNNDDDWPAVHTNNWKYQRIWSKISRILARDGTTLRV